LPFLPLLVFVRAGADCQGGRIEIAQNKKKKKDNNKD
jgi:hypothetical protein